MARKSLGKRIRFDVFKRDGFVCQYCGAHPPEAVLEVDHITAVASGGSNDIDNLVTACFSCNRGKAAEDLDEVPQSLRQRAAEVAEREKQLAGFAALMDAKRDRIEDEKWRVAEILEPGSSAHGMKVDWLRSIVRFNEKLGVHEVMDAADLARSVKPYGGNRMFLYFCGICHNKIDPERRNRA